MTETGSRKDNLRPYRVKWRDVGTVVSIFALLGILWSGVLFTFAVGFYEDFGVGLTDVGYSQQNVLSHAAIFAAILATAVFFFFLLFSSYGRVLASELRDKRTNGRQQSKDLFERLKPVIQGAVRFILLILGFVALIAVGVGLGQTYEAGRTTARDLREYTTPAVFSGVLDYDVAQRGIAYGYLLSFASGMTFTVGEAEWLQPGLGREQTQVRTMALLLGQNNGSTIAYDYCAKATLRLPTGWVTQIRRDEKEPKKKMKAEEAKKALSQYCAQVKRSFQDPGTLPVTS